MELELEESESEGEEDDNSELTQILFGQGKCSIKNLNIGF